jgi:hypothetical protein
MNLKGDKFELSYIDGQKCPIQMRCTIIEKNDLSLSCVEQNKDSVICHVNADRYFNYYRARELALFCYHFVIDNFPNDVKQIIEFTNKIAAIPIKETYVVNVPSGTDESCMQLHPKVMCHTIGQFFDALQWVDRHIYDAHLKKHVTIYRYCWTTHVVATDGGRGVFLET